MGIRSKRREQESAKISEIMTYARKIAAMYIYTLDLEAHPLRVLSVHYSTPQTAYDAYLAAVSDKRAFSGVWSVFKEAYEQELIRLCQPYVDKIAKTI